mgnify:FL=1
MAAQETDEQRLFRIIPDRRLMRNQPAASQLSARQFALFQRLKDERSPQQLYTKDKMIRNNVGNVFRADGSIIRERGSGSRPVTMTLDQHINSNQTQTPTSWRAIPPPAPPPTSGSESRRELSGDGSMFINPPFVSQGIHPAFRPQLPYQTKWKEEGVPPQEYLDLNRSDKEQFYEERSGTPPLRRAEQDFQGY